MTQYIKLVPKPVLEEPYNLSMISLYDASFREIWYHGEPDDSPQSHKNAQVRIRELWEDAGEKYEQWPVPIEIDLDLSNKEGEQQRLQMDLIEVVIRSDGPDGEEEEGDSLPETPYEPSTEDPGQIKENYVEKMNI